MPVVSVSRWKINPEHGSNLIREVAPILKQHGATRVAIARVHTGEHAGQSNIIVSYENWEKFGESLDSLRENTNYHRLYEEVRKNGAELQARNIASIEEIG